MDNRYRNERGCFSLRAGAIILQDGHVLMAGNQKQQSPYYSIGGAVKFNETAEEAVKREVWEETGIAYEVDRLIFIHENFFSTKEWGDVHEVCFYFLMKPQPASLPVCRRTPGEEEEYLYWIPLDRFAEYPAYPSFFAQELKALPKTVKHLITMDNQNR